MFGPVLCAIVALDQYGRRRQISARGSGGVRRVRVQANAFYRMAQLDTRLGYLLSQEVDQLGKTAWIFGVLAGRHLVGAELVHGHVVHLAAAGLGRLGLEQTIENGPTQMLLLAAVLGYVLLELAHHELLEAGERRLLLCDPERGGLAVPLVIQLVQPLFT